MNLDELKNKEIFQRFTQSKPIGNQKLHNILDHRDDVIFLWDKSACCLLTQGTKSICTTVQELYPTEHPDFDVTNVTVNQSGTKVALWSCKGVAVMDLPWRCGPRLEYQDGKVNILARCKTLDSIELGYGCEIVQVRWNPTAIDDSALIVLASNNSLYHIELMGGNNKNIKTARLGVVPSSRQRTLAALGEVAVDFSFISDKNALAMLVVRGNGDVHLVFGNSDIHSESQPLRISPLPDDNYLYEACAILCIPGKPTAVVLATTRGVIYHTLLVPLDVDQVDVPAHEKKYRLLVIESVVLDFGFLAPQDDLTVFPLRIIQDPSHPKRYLVIHPAGVHSVFLESLTAVEELLKTASSTNIGKSILEYLVCTSEPLLGCIAFPYTLLAIDTQNKFIAVPLRRIELPPFQLFTPDDKNLKDQGPLTRQLLQPFEQQIYQLLQESRVLPQMQLPTKDLSYDQALDLIVRIANLVRKVTVPRHREIQSILSHRINLIRNLHALQLQELKKLEEEERSIQQKAEDIAEQIQTVSDELEDQRNRVQRIARTVSEIYPSPTDAEARMMSKVTEIDKKVPEYSKVIESLKKDLAYQDVKICEKEKREYVLNSKQSATIHSCLSVLGESIKELVGRVNEMNDTLGVANQL